MAGEASAKSTKPALSLAPVFRNAHFQAVPCRDCDVPGYLILLPLTPADRFNDLGAPALAVLGPTFAALEGALIDIIGCERVYFLRLSEGLNSVHFHVFPRTAELAVRFHMEMTPKDADINGELLFYWARKMFKVDSPAALSPATLVTAKEIERRLSLAKT
jgi:diadenosine tetraphosphate (Ap4A) HIT family hydrolase